jgi:hypothetical protein
MAVQFIFPSHFVMMLTKWKKSDYGWQSTKKAYGDEKLKSSYGDEKLKSSYGGAIYFSVTFSDDAYEMEKKWWCLWQILKSEYGSAFKLL